MTDMRMICSCADSPRKSNDLIPDPFPFQLIEASPVLRRVLIAELKVICLPPGCRDNDVALGA